MIGCARAATPNAGASAEAAASVRAWRRSITKRSWHLFGACSCRRTGSHPRSSRGQAFAGTRGSRPDPTLPFRVHPAQFGLENLAVVVPRQRVDEDVVLRPLEAGDVAEAERIEPRAVGGAP